MKDERETRLCRQCYEHIDIRAKVCPHCRRTTGRGLAVEIKLKFAQLAFAVVATVVIYFALQYAIKMVVHNLSAATAKPQTPAVQKHQPKRR